MSKYMHNGVWCDENEKPILVGPMEVHHIWWDADIRDRMNYVAGVAKPHGFVCISSVLAKNVAEHICEMERKVRMLTNQVKIYQDAERSRKERERKQKARQQAQEELK